MLPIELRPWRTETVLFKCPAEGKCLTKSVVYQAEVTADNNKPVKYIGVTADDFKTRFRNHAKSLANKKYATETELSKHVWELKAAKSHSLSNGRYLRRLLPTKLVLEDVTYALRKNWLSWKTKIISYWTNETNCLQSVDMHVTRYLVSNCK